MKSPNNKDIQIEYDDLIQGYYIIWEPITTIGFGKTKKKALEDLREAAHLGIDTMINSKLNKIKDPIPNMPKPITVSLNN